MDGASWFVAYAILEFPQLADGIYCQVKLGMGNPGVEDDFSAHLFET